MSVKCFSITTKKKINKTFTVDRFSLAKLRHTGRANTDVAPGREGFSLRALSLFKLHERKLHSLTLFPFLGTCHLLHHFFHFFKLLQ